MAHDCAINIVSRAEIAIDSDACTPSTPMIHPYGTSLGLRWLPVCLLTVEYLSSSLTSPSPQLRSSHLLHCFTRDIHGFSSTFIELPLSMALNPQLHCDVAVFPHWILPIPCFLPHNCTWIVQAPYSSSTYKAECGILKSIWHLHGLREGLDNFWLQRILASLEPAPAHHRRYEEKFATSAVGNI